MEEKNLNPRLCVHIKKHKLYVVIGTTDGGHISCYNLRISQERFSGENNT